MDPYLPSAMLSGFVSGLIPVSTVTVVPVLCKRMTPALAIYTEAVNKLTKSAKVFMEHMHLLNEVRYEYQKALTTRTPLCNLGAGDQALRSLMKQLEQVFNAHLGEPALDRKKLEVVKAESTRTNSERPGDFCESHGYAL
jgi:hypothetical protein